MLTGSVTRSFDFVEDFNRFRDRMKRSNTIAILGWCGRQFDFESSDDGRQLHAEMAYYTFDRLALVRLLGDGFNGLLSPRLSAERIRAAAGTWLKYHLFFLSIFS